MSSKFREKLLLPLVYLLRMECSSLLFSYTTQQPVERCFTTDHQDLLISIAAASSLVSSQSLDKQLRWRNNFNAFSSYDSVQWWRKLNSSSTEIFDKNQTVSICFRTAISEDMTEGKAVNWHQHIKGKRLARDSIGFRWCIIKSHQKFRQKIYDSSFNKSWNKPFLSRPSSFLCSMLPFLAF